MAAYHRAPRRPAQTNAERQALKRARDRADPERAQRARQQYRELVARRRADPERYQAYLETRRIAYRLRLMRAGVQIEAVPAAVSQGRRLPLGPLRVWLAERALAHGGWEALAYACCPPGVSVIDRERTLHRLGNLSRPQGFVTEQLVDELTTYEGSTLAWEIYPELG